MERQPPLSVSEGMPEASRLAQPDRSVWLWAILVIVVAAFIGFSWIALRRTAQIVRPPVGKPAATAIARPTPRWV